MMRKRILSLAFLVALHSGGCGSDNDYVFNQPVTNVASGDVELNQVVLRAVTTFVTDFRISAHDSGGTKVFGPQSFPKAIKVKVSGVPTTASTLIVEYLAGQSVIGRAEVPIVVQAGQVTQVSDPAWVDTQPASVPTPLSATAKAVDVRPLSVVSGDFNNDGILDLATANNGGGSISVLLGRGDGSFGDATNHSTLGTAPFGIGVGDFNGDGFQDLVATNYGGPLQQGELALFLGDGTGSFAAATLIDVGSSPTSVAVADFNGDGKADIACTNYGDDTLSVLLGQGDATFQAPSFLPVGERTRAVAYGDLNGDGKIDLVTADEGLIIGGSPGGATVLLGRGDGSFEPGTSLAAGYNPHNVAIGDLDGDGNQDLVIANFNSSDFSVLLGKGDGTFKAQARYATSRIPLCIALGDFNRDGRPDISVACQGAGEVTIWTGKGDGSFSTSKNLKAGDGSFFVITNDFNRDGLPDFAVANEGSNNVSVILGGAAAPQDS